MLIKWEETSWRLKEIWVKDASDKGCPILEEYGQEPPSSPKRAKWMWEKHCLKCDLYTEPFDRWECCPYGQQMAQEVQELLEMEQQI